MAFFSLKTYLYRIFWLEFEISASELTSVPNFSFIGQEIKVTRILTLNDTKNSLMTSYVPPNDDVSKILWLLRDFVPEYHHAKFGCNWTTNKGETEGGHNVKKNRNGCHTQFTNERCRISLRYVVTFDKIRKLQIRITTQQISISHKVLGKSNTSSG